MTATTNIVAALGSRGAGAEANEEQVEQLVDKVSKLVGGKDAAHDLITKYLAAGNPDAQHAVLAHLEPDVSEALEQLMHLEPVVLKMLAYITDAR